MGRTPRRRGARRLQRGATGRTRQEGDVHVRQEERVQRARALRAPRASPATLRTPPSPAQAPSSPSTQTPSPRRQRRQRLLIVHLWRVV